MSTPTSATLQHLIAGRWTGEPDRERRNPARAQEVVARFPAGTVAETEEAIAAARAAAPMWGHMPAPARGDILYLAAGVLESRIEQVAQDLTREEGKTLVESRGEVRRAIDVLRFYGGEGRRLGGETIPSAASDVLVYTKREPLGVVAIITPWNFPIAIPAWKIAPALVSGNTVVFKPASWTPLSAHHLVQALVDAGLPAGVLNLVYGSGLEVGDRLVAATDVGGVSFTGSTSVGVHIHGIVSQRMARVQLEMGGKNPYVIAQDASPATAASVVAAGGFGLTGQACTATSRVIAIGQIAEPFIEALVREAAHWEPGDGLADGTRMGPVVSDTQLKTDLEYVRVGVSEGASIIAGGKQRHELFLEPTIFADVRPDQRVAREEIFGPIISVLRADDLEEAIAIANDTAYGLTAGICTNDLRAAHHFVDRVQVGIVKVNQPTTGLELQVPFGGTKASSTGTFREQGRAAIDFFTRSKSVYLNYAGTQS